MKHEYITHYETWPNGIPGSFGNQCVSLETAGAEAPSAQSVYDLIKAQAAQQSGHPVNSVRILGVFKL